MPPRRSTRRTPIINDESRTENPDIATLIAQQLQELIPNIVTQISDNINGGNPSARNHNLETNNNNRTGCTYKEFLACKPKEFDGKGGAIALTRWFEKIESVIDISNCSEDKKVRYASSCLTNRALTWWNTQLQARGRTAAMGMTWDEFKRLLKEEFCPNNQMQKLENEFWNHAMVGANHAAYTDRFHDLAKLVPHLVTPESKRIERYIYGLVPQIRGMVAATEPSTIQKAILKAGTLTDEMVRNGSLTKTNDKKRNEGESSRQTNNNDKRTKTVNAHMATNPKKEYIGPHPKCTTCNYHHPEKSPCRLCTNCNRYGHFTKDCRIVVHQVDPTNAVNPAGNQKVCYECGSPDHFRNRCPRLNRTQGQGNNGQGQPLAICGNQNPPNNNQGRGRAFVMGANEARQDPNIVTGKQEN